MSGKEGDNRELKALEAALGSLHPRADKLDPQWRSLLAEEASRLVAGATQQAVEPPMRGLTCVDPAGHRYVCLNCGTDMPARRTWAWPAVTGAVASLAAVLLVMLALQPTPQRGNQTIGLDALNAAANVSSSLAGNEDQQATALRDDTVRSAVDRHGWTILSVADIARHDDFVTQPHFAMNVRNNGAPATSIDMEADSKLTCAALMRQLLTASDDAEASGGSVSRPPSS
jgi:hypothetical protein